MSPNLFPLPIAAADPGDSASSSGDSGFELDLSSDASLDSSLYFRWPLPSMIP